MAETDLERLSRLVLDEFKLVHERFDTIDERFDRVEARLDRMGSRLDSIEAELKDIHTTRTMAVQMRPTPPASQKRSTTC